MAISQGCTALPFPAENCLVVDQQLTLTSSFDMQVEKKKDTSLKVLSFVKKTHGYSMKILCPLDK